MTEKWNKSCKCDCPEAAHVSYRPPHAPLYSDYTSMKCTANILTSSASWPCRCYFTMKVMVTKIGCPACGDPIPLSEPTWIRDLGGWDEANRISDDIAKDCPHMAIAKGHQPIDAAKYVGETTT